MLRRVGSVIGGVLVLTGFLSGCGGKPIVGVILPTTGAAASYGESIESGIRLAISDAREREGLPILLRIPFAREIAAALAAGEPLIHARPDLGVDLDRLIDILLIGSGIDDEGEPPCVSSSS